MRRLFDRLLVALIPYAGVLTVSTCGAPPECEESGESKTATMTARVEGDIALDTRVDDRINERIETTFAREGGGAAPEWRCEARVGASAVRQRADTSAKKLSANATVFCSIGDGRVTKRVWTLSVPLDDLRAEALAPDVTAEMDVSLQDLGGGGASCSAKVPVRVTTTLGSGAGASAAPPSWVTEDFARSITTTIAVDDSTTGSAERGCAQRFSGSLTLDITVDASSFAEHDTPTCL